MIIILENEFLTSQILLLFTVFVTTYLPVTKDIPNTVKFKLDRFATWLINTYLIVFALSTLTTMYEFDPPYLFSITHYSISFIVALIFVRSFIDTPNKASLDNNSDEVPPGNPLDVVGKLLYMSKQDKAEVAENHRIVVSKYGIEGYHLGTAMIFIVVDFGILYISNFV